MTVRQKSFRQCAIASVAMLGTAFAFGATVTASPVQAAGAYYRATLEQPVERRTEIIRGGTFICSGTACVGTKARSRPMVVCEKLASEFGRVTSFSVAGNELDEEGLASCRVDQD